MELHVHTRFSHDSILPLWLLRFVCFLRKIDCVAITDHNEVEGALRFRRRYPQMKVIVGEEIFSSEGEIIGLFLHDKIEPGLSAVDTIQRIHDQDGIVCIPHTADAKRWKTVLHKHSLTTNLDNIHCVEKFNGRTLSKEDIEQQCKIAAETGLPCVVGGDAHTFYELGRNYNIFKEPIDTKEDFLIQLSSIERHTSACLPLAHKSTKITRVIKLLMTGQFRELINKLIKKEKT